MQRSPRGVEELLGDFLKTSCQTTCYHYFIPIRDSLRTEGAFGLYSMVDSPRQQHTEPPSGRISVFEKGKLIGSFESWQQAVQFIRANHLRRATLVPESRGVNGPKRSNLSIAP